MLRRVSKHRQIQLTHEFLDSTIDHIFTNVRIAIKMSFQNFDTFQNQHPAADAAAAAPGAPATADTTMTGQADPSTAPFQGPAPGDGAPAVPQQGNEGKTTLWYVQP